MELLNSIFHFFTDKTKGLSYKATLILTTIVLIILIDNTLSFSYYYNTQRKIEQIDGLNKILSDTTLTDLEKDKLQNLRHNLIRRTTWKDRAWKLISEIKFKSENEENLKEPPKSQKEITRSYFWHYISSGWLFLLLALMMPFIGLKDKNTSLGTTLGILVIVEPIFLGIAWIYAKVFSFIPIIFGDPIYNYILNALMCLFSVVMFALIGKLQNKKK